jgi:hypothetical protein
LYEYKKAKAADGEYDFRVHFSSDEIDKISQTVVQTYLNSCRKEIFF